MEVQWLYLLAAAMVGLVILFMQRAEQGQAHNENAVHIAEAPEGDIMPAGRGARTARQRMRNAAGSQPEQSSSEGESEGDEGPSNMPRKVGKKKARRLEEKEERRRYREYQEAMREDVKKREALLEEDRRKNEEEEKKAQAKKEQEELKAREEQLKREQTEYEELKKLFVVEEEGVAAPDAERENMLQEFVAHIQEEKIVLLEELAGKFNMRTRDVISRLQDLEKEGRIMGVFDDRGKFICLTEEELRNVAKFINQRGRVSISEVAQASNRLVRLQSRSLAVV
eukprot:comp15347_c0_seq1/m.12224 comp15347_c0_seq1/g.12224  ORF comp15347_c0_seq1/g.12224 comp15347_c0_seq1/m.12224 type:complete len:283 (-) comp15347_c0_seq1:101-949(-)